MIDLVFATNNAHKIKEIKDILPSKINLLSLEDIGCDIEIPEDQDTIEKNSLQKAMFIFDLYKKNCFADDTGLETFVLNNEPGVHSARYAGEDRDFEKNIDKLLEKLKGQTNRKARFVTVITLILDGNKYVFEGEVKGEIILKRAGTGGFGYDSVFLPEGYSKTFGEMSLSEKNAISHRGLAVGKLLTFLNKVLSFKC